jgi:hypothetical protein
MSSSTTAAVTGSSKHRWTALVAKLRAEFRLALVLHINNYQIVADAYSRKR